MLQYIYFLQVKIMISSIDIHGYNELRFVQFDLFKII